MTQKMIQLVSMLLLAVLLAALAPAAGAQALQPSSITVIDVRTGVVSAKVNTNGEAFQFRVTDPKLLAGLRVGREVYANFTTEQVSLDGKSMCCTIISAPQTAAPAAGQIFAQKTAPTPSASAPIAQPASREAAAVPGAAGEIQNKLGPVQLCTITALNTYTGVLTAKENATGQIITIGHLQSIEGAKLFQTFKVGGKVDLQSKEGAALTSGSRVSVTVQGLPPVDGIVTSIGAAARFPEPAKLALGTAAAGGIASSLATKLNTHPPANYGPVVAAVSCSAESAATDLVITALGFNPARHVVYTIANCGSAATNLPFIVDLFMNGQRADTIEQKILPGGSQQTVTSELAVDQGCNQVTLLAVADPQHVISESSSDNHRKTAEITPPCPNLVVTEIKQVWVDLNTRYEVQFTIQNQGTGLPPIPVSVTEAVSYDDGVSIPENNGYTLNPLRPGQSVTFHDSKKHLATSTIDVEVIIDMQHMINVSNPNNDISRKTLGPH